MFAEKEGTRAASEGFSLVDQLDEQNFRKNCT